MSDPFSRPLYVATLALSLAGLGSAPALAADAAGCKDPVGLKRFQGATLFHCDVRNLAETTMATGKMTQYLIDDKRGVFQSQVDVEGRRSVAAYALPKGASAVEAWRNYKLDLTAKGYKILWEAKARDMGRDFGYQYADRDGFQQIFGYSSDTGRYGVAVKDEGGAKTYVSVYAIEYELGVDRTYAPESGQALVRVEAVETEGTGGAATEAAAAKPAVPEPAAPAPATPESPATAPAIEASAPAEAAPAKAAPDVAAPAELAGLAPRPDPAAQPGDAGGCYDPMGLKRFPGAKLVHCHNRDFDEITIGTSKVTGFNFDLRKPAFESQDDVAGRSTVSAYTLPRGASPAEAWSTAKAGLQTMGYTVVFEGKEPDLGGSFSNQYDGRNGLVQTFGYTGDTGVYGVAEKDGGGSKTYITVFAANFQGVVTPSLDIEKLQTIMRVQSVEVSALQDKMVSVESAAGDANGCKDPVGLKRFKGARLVHCDNRNFVETVMGTGKMTEYLIDAKRPVFETQVDLEGRSSVAAYILPRDASPAEAWGNYKLDFAAKGYKVLYEARDLDMGRDFGYQFAERDGLSQTFGYSAYGRYGVAVKEDGERKTYVSVYAIEYELGVTPNLDPEKGQTMIRLEAVETGPLEDKMQVVDAGAIAKSIADTGSIALYGILFDYDKSVIKPESRPTLDEIGKFLKDNPDQKFRVVGHTDAIGSEEYNLKLSRARAKAIVADLVQTYGIGKGRLTGEGAGLSSPVAGNDTEEGRAKNRRVELVAKK